MIEDDKLPTYPILDATPDEIMKIIGECFAFEYYLVPKSKGWLICENHHGRVIGVGTEVIRKMPASNV